jgi:hypothetical protein
VEVAQCSLWAEHPAKFKKEGDWETITQLIWVARLNKDGVGTKELGWRTFGPFDLWYNLEVFVFVE